MENQNINLIENENKSTKSKLLTWVATILLACAVGVCAVLNAVMPRYQMSSAYSVNESQEYVEFSENELNDFYFHDLSSKINTDIHVIDTSYISYLNNSYTYLEEDDGILHFKYDNSHFIWFALYDSQTTDYWSIEYSKFYLFDGSNVNYNSFSSSLRWYSSWVVENIQKSITLTASELNNNSYTYLANKLITDNPNLSNTYFVYNGNQYAYYSYDGDYFYWVFDELSIEFYAIDDDDYGEFSLSDSPYIFSDSVTIYSDYIVENLYAPNSPTTWLDDIIALLTGGIVGLSGGVGSGVSTLVSDIFISNNALSVMGGMIVVFAAISLAIGLCRWVMNFLTSLGAKK